MASVVLWQVATATRVLPKVTTYCTQLPTLYCTLHHQRSRGIWMASACMVCLYGVSDIRVLDTGMRRQVWEQAKANPKEGMMRAIA
jgi:hypothetical protein